MVWGSVISGAAGLAGGLLGSSSQKNSYAKQKQGAQDNINKAAGIYGEFSPEMLAIYRGLLPELRSLWSNQGRRVGDMYRQSYEQARQSSAKRTADSKQSLLRRGLLSSTNMEAFNRAQQAEDARVAMSIDAAKAGTYQQLAAAQASSLASGRMAAAGGIGNVAETKASFPLHMADFFFNNQPPYMSPNGKALGALGGSLWKAFSSL